MTRNISTLVVHNGHLICLCDDGTLWFQDKNPWSPWHAMPEIPQVPREQVREFNWAGQEGAPVEQADAEQAVLDELLDGKPGAASVGDAGKAVAEKAGAAKPAAARSEPRGKSVPAKPARAEDAEPRLSVKYWGSLAALLLLTAGVWGIPYLTASSPDSLAARALGSGNSQDRVEAAAKLAILPGPRIVPLLRKVAEQADDPKVQVVAMGGLVDRADIQSIPLFVQAMSHEDQAVRQTGYLGALRTMGVDKDNFSYRAEDPAEKREAALSGLRGSFVFGPKPSPPPPPK